MNNKTITLNNVRGALNAMLEGTKPNVKVNTPNVKGKLEKVEKEPRVTRNKLGDSNEEMAGVAKSWKTK